MIEKYSVFTDDIEIEIYQDECINSILIELKNQLCTPDLSVCFNCIQSILVWDVVVLLISLRTSICDVLAVCCFSQRLVSEISAISKGLSIVQNCKLLQHQFSIFSHICLVMATDTFQLLISIPVASELILPEIRTRQCRVSTIDRGRETALPYPLYYYGAAGIDIEHRSEVPTPHKIRW